MSTNYYIKTRDIDMAFDLIPGVTMDETHRCFSIHLAKTMPEAWKLKPVLEKHSYRTFRGLKEVLRNKNYIYKIYDEYEIEYTTDEFIKMLEEMNAVGVRGENNHRVDKDGFLWIDTEFD